VSDEHKAGTPAEAMPTPKNEEATAQFAAMEERARSLQLENDKLRKQLDEKQRESRDRDKAFGGVTARVRFTIDVPAGSSWGPDCAMRQVRDQAGPETVQKVLQILREARLGCTIVGEPLVLAVTARLEK
jgi:hypothetical protein